MLWRQCALRLLNNALPICEQDLADVVFLIPTQSEHADTLPPFQLCYGHKLVLALVSALSVHIQIEMENKDSTGHYEQVSRIDLRFMRLVLVYVARQARCSEASCALDQVEASQLLEVTARS